MEYHAYTPDHFDRIAELGCLSAEYRFGMKVVSQVLPFRVNRYVIDELIDWGKVPHDPMFRLVFPDPGMLLPDDFKQIASLLASGADRQALDRAVHEIRLRLNPHPAGQQTLNVPCLDGHKLPGLQHKYRETVLFFPRLGQTCHSYCSFCFRWPQFVCERDMRIMGPRTPGLFDYLRRHSEVTDLLVTGGDPLVMKAASLAEFLEPLLSPEFAHLQTIRIGTKSLSFWPYRFLTDRDADDLLRLFERLVKGGKHLAVMAHYNHWRELETEVARRAIERVKATGATIRTQSPVVAHVNDDPQVWVRLWQTQVRLGMVPYYLFVARDTGARHYFAIPLERCWQIYRQAIQKLSGLARTVRGPSMSAGPGKVEIQGVAEVGQEKVFVLRFIQARNPDWAQRPFFARYDPAAIWLDQLRPAFGRESFFYTEEYNAMQKSGGMKSGEA
ncbi:radical SAM domain iron-sulfur cluster-binding oxidoreductase [Syntrophotalea carbinolica DSM 2380]|uniref:Radical SAM domain iron-sulfur cluster-binding oxidoreductase n=1 Tax=Syntrophotalea carbinolica (strain DSM 2380 / NBRC 103641 / GraBd1) TaxID=338963 RepID=Q3A6K4_SYNC1|nr:lysine 2,3-aminomutase [Syntrophotalea carbinolica]ABA88003.1 radical SAM domain iron-sulfur cluster-binding oxidoreductase [Syntrophotalea carbinolica DSM 2380]